MGRMAPDYFTGFAAGVTTAVAIGALHGQWDMYSLGYMGAFGCGRAVPGAVCLPSRYAEDGPPSPLDMARQGGACRPGSNCRSWPTSKPPMGCRPPTSGKSSTLRPRAKDIPTLKTLQYQAHNHAVQHPGDGTVVVSDPARRAQGSRPCSRAGCRATDHHLRMPGVRKSRCRSRAERRRLSRIATGPASGSAKAWGGISAGDTASPVEAGKTASQDAGSIRRLEQWCAGPIPGTGQRRTVAAHEREHRRRGRNRLHRQQA